MTKEPLHVSSDVVGLYSGVQQFNVSFRDVSNFAAAIGDNNPRYFDSLNACAHPIFPVTMSWQILQHRDNVWAKRFSLEIRNRMVHYDEHIEFNKNITTGDVLTANSQIIGMEKHKLGTKIQLKISYQTEKGVEVITEYVSSILFGVTCDEDKVVEKSPIDINNSDRHDSMMWEESINIDKTAPYMYDGCTGISAPIHTDENYARSIGLPGIIYHGTATLARSVTAIINKELGGDASRIKSISSKFTGKLTIPNTLHVNLIAHENKHISFLTNDKTGQSILAGNLTIR